MLSRNDYKILSVLYQYECTNELKSITINKINELSDLSVSKVRVSIKTFKNMDYIAEGVLQHKAKTYYITELGIEKLQQLM